MPILNDPQFNNQDNVLKEIPTNKITELNVKFKEINLTERSQLELSSKKILKPGLSHQKPVNTMNNPLKRIGTNLRARKKLAKIKSAVTVINAFQSG